MIIYIYIYMQIPIFKNFLATSYFKAFVINSLVISLLSVAAMTTHASLHSQSGTLNKFFNKVFYGNSDTISLKFEETVLITFVITFLSVLFIMMILYILIGFGGGMITPLDKSVRKQIPFTELF